jgi:hypothetical protein
MFAHLLLVVYAGHVYYELKRTLGRVMDNYFRGVSTALYLSISVATFRTVSRQGVRSESDTQH